MPKATCQEARIAATADPRFLSTGKRSGWCAGTAVLGAPGKEASILKDTVRTGQLEVATLSLLTKSGPLSFEKFRDFFFN